MRGSQKPVDSTTSGLYCAGTKAVVREGKTLTNAAIDRERRNLASSFVAHFE